MDIASYLLGKRAGGGGGGALEPIVVEELPETGETGKLYLVPKQEETENDVFDEYLWVDEDWELIGTARIDISGKQDKMQFATMPSASSTNVGQIVQYIGTTNANYTNGYFYICLSDGGDPATYSWSALEVQKSDNVEQIYFWVDDNNTYSGSQFNKDSCAKLLNCLKNNTRYLLYYATDYRNIEKSQVTPFGVAISPVLGDGEINGFILNSFYRTTQASNYNYLMPSANAGVYKYFNMNYSSVSGNVSIYKGDASGFHEILRQGQRYNQNVNQTLSHETGGRLAWSNGTLETVSNNIAPTYDTSVSYGVGDYVTYNNILYVCNTATTGNWDSAKWTQTSVASILGNINTVLATLTTPSNNGGN